MKARVKATGEIVDIISKSAFDKDVFYGPNGQKYNREKLSFDFKEKSFPKDEDYWERLEHQYAGMAMQGILTNPIGFENLRVRGGNLQIETALLASEFAHALVEKMKEERK